MRINAFSLKTLDLWPGAGEFLLPTHESVCYKHAFENQLTRTSRAKFYFWDKHIHWNFNCVKLKDMSLKLNTEENCVVDWRKVIGRRGQVLNPEASTKLDKFCRLNRFVLSSATFLKYIDFSDNGRNVIYRFQRILNKNNHRFF